MCPGRDSSCAPGDWLCDQGGIPRVLLVIGCVHDQGGIPRVLLVIGCVHDQGGIPRVLLVIGCVTWKGFLVCS